MPRKTPFKHHRFPAVVILCAVRIYLRYPLSYQDAADLLAERGVHVDRSTVYRWVRKFGPQIAAGIERRRQWVGLNWHVDETYIRVGGKWRYLWRAIDRHGHLIDFRLTAKRDAKAARAFLRKAIEKARLHRPVTICTDKAPTYRKVIQDENRRYDPHFDSIRHIDKKWRNNRIESDHAALKRLLGYRQSFRSLSSAKATLKGIEAIRTIKNRHVYDMRPGIQGEIALIHEVFGLDA